MVSEGGRSGVGYGFGGCAVVGLVFSVVLWKRGFC